jgi:hypothetical protein
VHRGSIVVALIGIVVTLALALGAASVNSNNEDRLLRQRAREVGDVAKSAVSTVQTPLSAGAFVAEATGGNVADFKIVMTPLVQKGGLFISASLWNLTTNPPSVITSAGATPTLEHESAAAISAYFAKANATSLAILDHLSTTRQVGYAVTAFGAHPHYAVYTETELSKNRKASISSDPAFGDLGYALYLGKKPIESQLLASSTGRAVTGRTASANVAFGNTSITIVIKAQKQLGGSLLLWLPWILAAFGVVLTAGSTLLIERLIRRRAGAEALASALDVVASENARLYNEQRSVARTLQHTLLPSALPDVGFELGARYVAGEADVEIGGDWYDIVPLPGGAVLFVIGDVSGRGIPAATVMASLRYAVRAYALQGDAPATILTKLARLLSIKEDGHFATVLCGRIDTAAHRLEVASAGHLDPLLITGGRGSYVATRPGVPIGATTAPDYHAVTVDLPAAGTLLLYTDGLIERRGESLDDGFGRLARAAEAAADAPVEDLLGRVVRDLIPGGASDDTALLGLRWN